ncbi:MAG TPA: formylmethanofuran dehydrogenase subunit E family protein [Methanomassiliicoccales archaeon]|nr:formylmethanofuran dehydrogenase subunit E family protein [Methanomassiliicoccales archaeon]
MHTALPPPLDGLARFHGHLGPYVVVGFRMGSIAREGLKGKIRAVAFTGLKPSLSCTVDGIQFASGCTLGKGNIEVRDENRAKAIFTSSEEELEISLREEVRRDIDGRMSKANEEELALSIFHSAADTIFEIRRTRRTLPPPEAP